MHCLNSRRKLIRIWHIDIDYYMAFFISYLLSALGHDIWTRADKGYYMQNDMLKKGSKISKVQWEGVNGRRTYDTMVKWKKTKGQTTIYKTPHKKVRIGQQEPTKNWCHSQDKRRISFTCIENVSFDIRILITPLVSSNSSWKGKQTWITTNAENGQLKRPTQASIKNQRWTRVVWKSWTRDNRNWHDKRSVRDLM
jgi:hypothetical protein